MRHPDVIEALQSRFNLGMRKAAAMAVDKAKWLESLAIDTDYFKHIEAGALRELADDIKKWIEKECLGDGRDG